MNVSMSAPNAEPRNLVRSTAAVFAGFFAGAVLSLGTDQILHVLHVYPPWGEKMDAPALNLLALSYRCVYNVLGFYLMAKLAPRNPMRHVRIGTGIGFVLAAIGAIAALGGDLGPAWYPIALALATFPCAAIAAALYRKRH